MLYTHGKYFKVSWGLSGQHLVRSSFYPRGQIVLRWVKIQKCTFLKIPQWPDFEIFFGDRGGLGNIRTTFGSSSTFFCCWCSFRPVVTPYFQVRSPLPHVYLSIFLKVFILWTPKMFRTINGIKGCECKGSHRLKKTFFL